MLQLYQKYGITAQRLNSTLAAICNNSTLAAICKLWEALKEFFEKLLELCGG